MIDYKLLNESIEFYESEGFTRIEVPWMVTEYIDSITRPKDAIPYRIENKKKNLIASGEQGFLYLLLKEYLPPGKYQTITPCFRNDSYDFTHTKQFLKNELIIVDPNMDKKKGDKYAWELLRVAKKFFKVVLKSTPTIVADSTAGTLDLEFNEVEVGSYGFRTHDNMSWAYGTGCAEPRTSTLIKKFIKENE